MRRETLIAIDGKNLSLALWDEVDNARAVVQIAHGMAEHIARYAPLAERLNANGYIVVGLDQRGHGCTDGSSLGINAGGDMFELTVSDQIQLTALLKSRYNLPVILLGHSYGSFITQRYLDLNATELTAVVLSGSALMDGIAVKLGVMLAKGKLKKHADEEGKLFANMTFVQYAKHFGGEKSCWLSRDQAQVEKYRQDPLSGFTCSNGFYYYFFSGLKRIAKTTAPFTAKLPMLIISGSEDPVGGYGKLVKKLNNRYIRRGLSPVCNLYDGARHELFNETNAQEVITDLLKFIDQALK